MRNQMRVFGGMLAVIVMAVMTPCAWAEVKSASAGKFKIEQELILPATPNEVFDAATGDILPWCDHSFSAHPKKLYIEAKPGGGFYEIFDDAGNVAKHATVIYAERGKTLRYEGPLGLSGIAVDLVTTYSLSSDPAGTKFHLTVVATGDVDESAAKAVDGVWHHFLDERLKPYISSGEYKKHLAGPSSPEGNGAAASARGAGTAGFTIADIAWLSGRWTGSAGAATTEENCTAPSRGLIECMFQVMDSEKILGLEFITLREVPATADKPATVEERTRFFSPDLGEKAGDEGATLRLASSSATETVLDNVKPDGVVKHITITRQGEDEFSTHIEVVSAEGKKTFIDSKWKRER